MSVYPIVRTADSNNRNFKYTLNFCVNYHYCTLAKLTYLICVDNSQSLSNLRDLYRLELDLDTLEEMTLNEELSYLLPEQYPLPLSDTLYLGYETQSLKNLITQRGYVLKLESKDTHLPIKGEPVPIYTYSFIIPHCETALEPSPLKRTILEAISLIEKYRKDDPIWFSNNGEDTWTFWLSVISRTSIIRFTDKIYYSTSEN